MALLKFLIDKSPNGLQEFIGRELVLGQLITPLTGYANFGGVFGMDNGACNVFNEKVFKRLLEREERNRNNCLFVTVPDVVGDARRTMEIWKRRHHFVRHWPLALVAQNGIEDMEIPWDEFECLFIGGKDPWKDSQAVVDIVKTAKILRKHVHVGRVNNYRCWSHFNEIGADTCDGSGVAKYSHMLEKIEEMHAQAPKEPLFENLEQNEEAVNVA